mmetsp:Transcript_100382/g.199171  ORF Transcript_100382/g.199171 Transcript_100382/m.199171 type:complete len:611 (-) Transcript_100382:57-1889(-)
MGINEESRGQVQPPSEPPPLQRRYSAPLRSSNNLQLYKAWCERSKAYTSPARHLLLEHLGRAPVEVPPHPARLTPVRRMAKKSGKQLPGLALHPRLQLSRASSFSGSGESSSRPDTGDAAETTDGVIATELMNILMPFSSQCTGMMSSQTNVEAFSARKVFSACEFFDSCSLCFIRELVASGEPALWQGISFDSGSIVYSEGERGASMYVVVRGQAESSAKDRGSRTFAPHDYFGEAQALGVLAKRQETMHAATPLHVLEVSCNTLTDLLGRKREVDPTGTGMNDGSNVYAFAEERTYFERVAEDVYQSFTRRRRQRGRLAGGGISRDDDQELAELANRLKAQLSKVGGTPSSLAQATELMSRQQSPRGGARPFARRPSAGGLLVAPLPDPAAVASSASAMDNPAAWRKRVERAQAAMEGQTLEDIAAVLRYMEKLKASIRMDLRRGYKMPVDVVQAQKEFGLSGKAKVDAWLDVIPDEASDANPRTPPRSRRRSRRHSRQDPLADPSSAEPEVVANDTTNAIDLHLLPPFRFMNTKQKHLLLQQLERQVASRPVLQLRRAGLVTLAATARVASGNATLASTGSVTSLLAATARTAPPQCGSPRSNSPPP